MNRWQQYIRCGLCAGVILVAGCASHHTSSRTAHLLDDKVVSERVKVALRRASPAAFEKVQIDTADGVVTLSGSVPNLGLKTKAAQIARSVQKVRDVDNRLGIQGVPAP